jgi:hypothetical protein
MLFGKKTLVAIVVGLFMIAGIAATKPPEAPKYKNLKILPKNISKEDLDKVMDHFKTALGVKCSFAMPLLKTPRRNGLILQVTRNPKN